MEQCTRGLSAPPQHKMYKISNGWNTLIEDTYMPGTIHLSTITHTVRKLHQPIQHPIQRVENLVVRFAKAIMRDDVAEDMRRRDAMVRHGRRRAFDGCVRIRRVLDGGCWVSTN